MSDFIESICEKIRDLPEQESIPAILLVNGQRQCAGTIIMDGHAFYPTTFDPVPVGAKVVLKVMDSDVSYDCSRFEPCQTGSPHFHFGIAEKKN